MRNRKIIVMLAGAMFLLGGCIKEEVWTPQDGPADGTTRIALSIGDAEQVVTRSEASDNECKINDAYLLVFHKKEEVWKYKTGEKVDVATGIIFKDSNKKTPIITTKCLVEKGDTLVVLLNTTIGVLPTGLTDDTTPDDLNVLFPSTLWNLNTEVSPSTGAMLPMSGGVLVKSDRDPITNALTVPGCRIRRSVAKIALAVNVAPADDITTFFTAANVSWGMYNVLNSSRAALCTPVGKVSMLTDLSASDFTATTGFIKQPIQSGAPLSKQSYYMPQYPNATMAMATVVAADKFAKDRTCMLLKVYDEIEDGVPTIFRYYRIDLYDHTANKFIDITPNTHITVTVTKVMSYGYTTPEEALANPGSNLEYEIKVTGDSSNVVLSNGQYALSLEYDSMVLFPSLDIEQEYSLGMISFIDMAGAGVPTTNKIEVLPWEYDGECIVLTGAKTFSTTPQEFKFKLTDAATNYAYHQIKITVGTIVKYINIFIGTPLQPKAGVQWTFFSYAQCSEVKWLHKVDGIELTVGKNPNLVSSEPPEFRIDYTEHIIPENVDNMSKPDSALIFKPRVAEGYFLREEAHIFGYGRSKVIVYQGAPEYLGWFGGTPDNSGGGRYSKRLISYTSMVESYMQWWTNNGSSGLNVRNKETGLDNTKAIMAGSTSFERYFAAEYCWRLNDVNDNGKIDADEEVNWYLPAQNQLMAAGVVYKALHPWTKGYYWTSTMRSVSTVFSQGFDWGDDNCLSAELTDNSLYIRCVRDI